LQGLLSKQQTGFETQGTVPIVQLNWCGLEMSSFFITSTGQIHAAIQKSQPKRHLPYWHRDSASQNIRDLNT